MTPIQMQINLGQDVIEQAVRNLIKEQGIDAPISSVDFETSRQRGKPDEVTATINIGAGNQSADTGKTTQPVKADEKVLEGKPQTKAEEEVAGSATASEDTPETVEADAEADQKESLFG